MASAHTTILYGFKKYTFEIGATSPMSQSNIV